VDGTHKLPEPNVRIPGKARDWREHGTPQGVTSAAVYAALEPNTSTG